MRSFLLFVLLTTGCATTSPSVAPSCRDGWLKVQPKPCVMCFCKIISESEFDRQNCFCAEETDCKAL